MNDPPILVIRLGYERVEVRVDLVGISGRLNDGGKSMVFKAAVLVAQADGEVTKDEERLLKKTYKALDLSKSQAAQIRSSVN